jgi:signal transduction histidine kinase/DNA-binding response OmpR family regulator
LFDEINMAVIFFYIFLCFFAINALNSSAFASVEMNGRIAFTVQQGLPSNRIFDIERDHKGYIWLATDQGAVRFDGAKLLQFSQRKTPNLSQSHWVRKIIEDSQKRLWVGGKQGLELLNKNTEFFEKINNASETSENIYDIFESTDQQIWVGTERGLRKIVGEQLITVPLYSSQSVINSETVLSLTEIDEENLMLAMKSGTYMYNKESHYVTPVVFSSQEPVYADKVGKLPDGTIWLSIHGLGLGYYDRVKSEVRLEHLDQEGFETTGYVYDVAIQDEKTVAASLNSGLLSITSHGVQSSPLYPPLLTLFSDINVNIYGSFNDGIFKSTPISRAFRNTLFNHSAPYSSYEINDIAYYQQAVWIADHLFGLCKYSIEGIRLNCIEKSSSIHSLSVDGTGYIWASMYDALLKIDPSSGQVLARFELSELSIPEQIYSIVNRKLHEYWLSHSFAGITHLNTHTRAVVRYNTDNSDLLSDRVHKLIIKDNKLWIATSKGLQSFDVVSGEFSDALLPPNSSGLSVYDLLLDDSHIMWMQTNDGTKAYNTQLKHWLTLPDKITHIENASMGHAQGVVWFAYAKGIVTWEHASKKLRYYDQGDGLFPNGYLPSATALTGQGEFLFASTKGFTTINPHKLDLSISRPVISEVVVTHASGGQQRFFNQLQLHNIPYDHASLRFSFANLNMQSSSKHHFKYKVIGLTDIWFELGNERDLVIPKLSWGQYSLIVQSTDSEGNWDSERTKFDFSVATPWYATKTATLIYILVLLLAIKLLYRARLRALREKQRLLEQEVKRQTMKIGRQNEKLSIQARDLSKAQSERSTLLRTLSHELMTPITLLQGPAEQIIRQKEQSQRVLLAELIASNAKRLKVLVEQLMMMSSEQPNNVIMANRHDFSSICLTQIKVFNNLLASKNMTCHIDIVENIHVMAGEDELEKCVSNLLSNAIKYSPPNSHLEITLHSFLREQKEICRLQIKDQGIGIEADYIERIFNTDYRTSAGRKFTQGQGIGLSVVKELVNKIGGNITVASEVGKGSCFGIEFVVSSHLEPNLKKTKYNSELSKDILDLSDDINIKDDSTKGLSKSTVLIVDDTPDMLSFIVSIFAKQFKVVTAKDGHEGILAANECLPDLIISDVMMPKLDGFEFLAQIKSNELTGHIPVLLLTANMSDEKKIKGLKLCANDYLHKPFSVPELELKVRNILQLQNANQERWQREIQQRRLGECKPEYELIDSASVLFMTKIDQTLSSLFSDSSLSVSQLAKELALSERQLHRKLTSVAGVTPNEYIRQYRLYQSQSKLQQGVSVSQVSNDVGFNSPAYFSACFKKQFAMTPKQYVQSIDNTEC